MSLEIRRLFLKQKDDVCEITISFFLPFFNYFLTNLMLKKITGDLFYLQKKYIL